MKYNGLFKKLAATATAVGMLASLGTTAFAEKLVTESAIDISEATATYTTSGTDRNYTVTLKYTGVASDAQVSVLGYVYDSEWNITPADSAIYAVDQDAQSAYNGTITLKLSTAVRSLSQDAKLVVKVGTDDANVSTAQAVLVDLATATEVTDPMVITKVLDAAATVAYGADASTASLPATVSVEGTVAGEADTSEISVIWNYAGLDTTKLGNQTITGTLVDTNEAFTNEADFTAEAVVTVEALTAADAIEPVTAIEVAQDADAAAIAAKIRTVTVKSGDITDTYAVTAANVSGFDTSTLGATSATIAISGKSANGIFDLAEMTTTVDITVVEQPTISGMYGDIYEDGSIDDLDWMTLLNHCLGLSAIDDLSDPASAAFKAADLFVDSSIDDLDWMTLLNYCLGLSTSDTIGTEF